MCLLKHVTHISILRHKTCLNNENVQVFTSSLYLAFYLLPTPKNMSVSRTPSPHTRDVVHITGITITIGTKTHMRNDATRWWEGRLFATVNHGKASRRGGLRRPAPSRRGRRSASVFPPPTVREFAKAAHMGAGYVIPVGMAGATCWRGLSCRSLGGYDVLIQEFRRTVRLLIAQLHLLLYVCTITICVPPFSSNRKIRRLLWAEAHVIDQYNTLAKLHHLSPQFLGPLLAKS